MTDTATILEGEIIEPAKEIQITELRDVVPAHRPTVMAHLLSEAHNRLVTAAAVYDLTDVANIKALANTLQETARQLRLGEEIQADAAEFTRRAERALGLAIREGQRRGEVAGHGHRSCSPREQLEPGDKRRKISPKSFITGGTATVQIYGMADDVTDDMFNEVLAAARAEGNLTRRNVSRHARAKAIARSALADSATDPEPPPPPKIKKTAAARKVMLDLVITINSVAFILADTDPAEVDKEKHLEDIQQILQGIASIKRFINDVKDQP